MKIDHKKPLVILTGPTAVGKTAISIKLAKLINGEIISADSMQVYNGMDIGTAKVTVEEMEGIPHHLVNILEPTEEFNVVLFKELALKAMEDIYSKNKIPIIVGGTGFYIQALLYDISFEDTNQDTTYRKELEELAKANGNEYIHNMLLQVDVESANTIHPNNLKRVIRALEYYRETNSPISKHNEIQKTNVSPYNFMYFVLNDDRELMYERINKRIDIMLEEGLLEEVIALKEAGYNKNMVSMQGIGYKEVLDYIEGITTLDEAIFILKRDTRHFAKRQITWFKREKEVTWLNRNELGNDDKILEYAINLLKERGIING